MQNQDNDISLKDYFVPLTNAKAITFIILIGLIVYANALFNGFVWDDFAFILNNLDLRTTNVFQLFIMNVFNNGGYYRPLSALYFYVLYHIFGNQAFYYHLIQVLLHIVNTGFLFLLLKKFVRKPIAFFSALIFLLHPIQVESVVYIGATQSELFTIFGLGGLLQIMSNKKDTIIKWVLVFISLLFSILVKETGILFLLMAIIYINVTRENKYLSKSFLLGSIVFIYCVIRLGISKIYFEKAVTSPISWLPIWQRIINIPSILFYYIRMFFFPSKMAIDQLWTISSTGFSQFYLPLLICIGFIVGLYFGGYYVYRNDQKIFIGTSFSRFGFCLGWVCSCSCFLWI